MARHRPETRYAQSSGAKIAYQVSCTAPGLRSNGPQTLHADTIGAAWLDVYETERAYLLGVLAGSWAP